MAHEIIFHNYPNSPFSEKVRVAFGIKKLAWRSVIQPVIMPKPDLIPLTGGYRKIPVMQIGADIFCDTQIILREIERRFPAPSLVPHGRGLPYGIGFWADRQIFQAGGGHHLRRDRRYGAGRLQEGSRGDERRHVLFRSAETRRAVHARSVSRAYRLPRRTAGGRPRLPGGRRARPWPTSTPS